MRRVLGAVSADGVAGSDAGAADSCAAGESDSVSADAGVVCVFLCDAASGDVSFSVLGVRSADGGGGGAGGACGRDRR